MNRGFVEDDIRLRLMKHISDSNSHLTQRDLADFLGLSLGKTHYCLTELINKDFVKTTRTNPWIETGNLFISNNILLLNL